MSRAEKRIKADIRKEFDELREKLSRHLEAGADVDQERQKLAEHILTEVVTPTQRLLDTLLNYLMEDAIAALADTPTSVKNEFYDLDLRRRVKQSFTLEPEPVPLKFSRDPRVTAGGVAAGATAAAGGLMIALYLSGPLVRIVGGAVTLVASAIAFRIAYTSTTRTALQWLRDDVDTYMTQSERQVSSWLTNVEAFFVSAFKEFQYRGGQAKEGTP